MTSKLRTLKRRPQLLLDCHKGTDRKMHQNFCDCSLEFMNHNISHTRLLNVLSTKQKQLVYNIGGQRFFNCCSDTTPILVRTWKYTGIAHSFIICAVRKFLVQ